MIDTRSVLAAALALIMTGCAVGPDYVRPPFNAPTAFKESGPWKTAEPKQADFNGKWWELYGDPALNTLIEEANSANLDIRVAEAQYRQARSLEDVARSAYFPVIGVNLSASRARTNTNPNGVVIGNLREAVLDASWEPDLWGRVRRTVEASAANRQAGADDLAAVRLAIQAELAQDYFQIRIVDAEKDLFDRSIEAYRVTLKLTQSQFAAGIVTRVDVALARTQFESASAEAVDLDVKRNQLEHAIAILLGKPPGEFALPAAPLVAKLPVIPVGLPSELLERRPDIAAAERRTAAANANIGIAQSAYFPTLSIGSSGGFAHWFNQPSRVWSLGAGLAETIFDGGLRSGQTAEAIAAYDASVAQYRKTVLNGFQEVEDDLATLRVLDQEAQVQTRAVSAAKDAEQLTMKQYKAGTAIYLAVAAAQVAELNNERTDVELLGRQFDASIGLIKAIGGGWQSSQSDQTAEHPADPRTASLSSAQQ
jgi:NodT family efflux transporter outer membrane factor (OMF) lipoprotein